MKTIILSYLTFLLLYSITAEAQFPSIERYVVSSAGGTYTNGGNLEVDYTIGETAVLTLSNTNNFLTQGFQQPYEEGVFINDLENVMNISYYPNPVTSRLTLSIYNTGGREFNVEMFDILGQIVLKQKGIACYEGAAGYTFNMKELTTGNYFLRISSGGDFVKNIKIIKTTF